MKPTALSRAQIGGRTRIVVCQSKMLATPKPRGGLCAAVINRAVANLMHLSWIWECDYGWMQEGLEHMPQDIPWWRWAWRKRTFFGLNPTQQSAVITAKEQYEAWIYLTETLQRTYPLNKWGQRYVGPAGFRRGLSRWQTGKSAPQY